MDSMAEQYPALVSVETYGQSSEGRDMKVMKISTGGVSSKPAVWLDGGIHARGTNLFNQCNRGIN
jgi:murein tripeptide amidase MpaA